MSVIKNIFQSLTGKTNDVGHGDWEDANSGWVDSKPYVSYFTNGIFIGHDGSIWKYYMPPEDVAIEWLKDSNEAVANQQFFLEVVEKLGEMLDSQTEKLRNDLRRNFHIQITQSEFKGIKVKPNTPPKQADYINRMSSEIGSKPVWDGFVGFQLLPGSIFYEAYSTSAKLQRWWDFIKSSQGIEWAIYQEDIETVDALMAAAGFDEPDFTENPELFEKLTAWHGISDESYGLSQELQSTRMQQMTHGLSVITPRWGEMTFHAIRPKDVADLVDPREKDAQWGATMFRPGSDVVVINIRGQIRSPSVSDNLLDLKNIRRQDGNHGDHKDQRIIDLTSIAKNVVEEVKLPMLDNVEIVVGSRRFMDKKIPIVNMMKGFGLQAAPLVGRQHLAMLTTFPTFPRHIARIPRGIKKRPELVNVMMPGVIAMSGIFRNTGGADNDGIIMGLSDDGQFEEIYMDPGAANRKGGVPGMLITGRPGAGKALTLDARIMTPNGYTRMGDIQVGDTVFGRNGKTAKVTFVTEIMENHELFKITLSDGQEIIADSDHQWVVSIPSDRYYYKGRDEDYIWSLIEKSSKISESLVGLASSFDDSHESSATELYQLTAQIIDTEDNPWEAGGGPAVRNSLEFVDCPYEIVNRTKKRIYSTAEALRHLALRVNQRAPKAPSDEISTRRITTGEMYIEGQSRGESRYSIPLAEAIQYTESDLLVDPYIVGLWLGDGETGAGRIATGNIGMSTDENGVGDMQFILPHLTKYDPQPKTGMEDYVLSCHGLATELRQIGILNNKHIPESYLHGSFDQRLALLQGLLDSDGGVNSDAGFAFFTNSSPRLMEQTTELVRSLGIKVHDSFSRCVCESDEACECYYEAKERKKLPVVNGREIVQRKNCMGIAFFTDLPVFRLPRKLNKLKRNPAVRTKTLMIRSIEPVETQPVRCISVDSDDHTYLIEGAVVTSNTQQLLQLTSQLAYRNNPVFFFNPKKVDTLKDAFDLIDGLTISMETAYLDRNPGLLDPFNFLSNRKEIAQIICDSLFTGMNMYSDVGSSANKERTKIQREIQERAVEEDNLCAGDIIFGNSKGTTKALTDESVVEFIKDKMMISSFWKAFISKNPNSSASLKKQMESGRPVLIEWGKSMQLPDISVDPKDYTGPQSDSVLSINVTFMYASAITGSNVNGGTIIVDESWVLKSSKEALKIIETGGREWRQADITLILATQKITDWMSDDSVNMSTYFSRYLIMSIMQNDDRELAAFYKLSRLPEVAFNSEYIKNAARSVADADSKRGNRRGYNPIPKAYYIDYLSGFESGIVCGPWPTLELSMGRSDKAGTHARRSKNVEGEEEPEDEAIEFEDLRGFKGALAEIANETRVDLFVDEDDLEDAQEEIPIEQV